MSLAKDTADWNGCIPDELVGVATRIDPEEINSFNRVWVDPNENKNWEVACFGDAKPMPTAPKLSRPRMAFADDPQNHAKVRIDQFADTISVEALVLLAPTVLSVIGRTHRSVVARWLHNREELAEFLQQASLFPPHGRVEEELAVTAAC